MTISELAKRARAVSPALAAMSGAEKNAALAAIADALAAAKEELLAANARDLSAAGELTDAVKKRLVFDEKKLAGCIEGLHALEGLEEPVGRVLQRTELDRGLVLDKVTCPIGVIGIIFEARPDALVQIASLCLKSGNVVLLKGGREAAHTNAALYEVIARAGAGAGLPEGWITLLHSREDVGEMLACEREIDLIIPRGSNAFVRYIMEHTRIPVMGHADGVCHIYVDRAADFDMALRVIVDAKTQYAAACNAVECVLVDRTVAAEFLPLLAGRLEQAGVTWHSDETAMAAIGGLPIADFAAEYLAFELSVAVVDGLDAAIAHINTHGSHHTDAILTADPAAAERFMNLVDSADVFWNCSTRFADGFRFGFGAEVGIATSKIHARGPVGLEGLLIYKYKLRGNGQIVEDYAAGRAHFTHKPL